MPLIIQLDHLVAGEGGHGELHAALGVFEGQGGAAGRQFHGGGALRAFHGDLDGASRAGQVLDEFGAVAGEEWRSREHRDATLGGRGVEQIYATAP